MVHLKKCFPTKMKRADVVAQLTARSLPIPEGPGSNPFKGNYY